MSIAVDELDKLEALAKAEKDPCTYVCSVLSLITALREARAENAALLESIKNNAGSGFLLSRLATTQLQLFEAQTGLNAARAEVEHPRALKEPQQ